MSSSRELRIHRRSQLNKQLPKTMTSQHQLSKIEHEFKPLFFGVPTSIISFFSQIKNLQSLTTFNLQVSQFFRFHTTSCLKPLIKSLASLKKLSNLNIIIENSIKDLELLKMLFKYLQRIKTLTSISLSFCLFNSMPTSTLDGLSSGLAKLLQLRNLELHFEEPFELHGEMINKLALVLPRLHLLAKIDIRFDEFSTDADAILNLFSCLKKIKTLSDISLAIRHKPRNNSEDPISQGLSLLDPSCIQKLSLQARQHFDNNGLIQFSEALKKFIYLQTLQLGLYISRPYPREGIAALLPAICSLASLSSLTIYLDSLTSKKIIQDITVLFKGLKNLVRFELQISRFTSPARQEDVQRLFTNFRFLKRFLRFFSLSYPSKTFTDKNLETLAESLKEMTLLENLSIGFSYAALITNQGVEALACSIKTLMNLSGLKIWLRKNDNLDNQAICQIAQILRELPCLYSVNFNFLSCSMMTCFGELLEVLKRVKNIREIALSLPSSVVTSSEMGCIVENKVVKRMTSC